MEDLGEGKTTWEWWGLGRNGLVVGLRGHMLSLCLTF